MAQSPGTPRQRARTAGRPPKRTLSDSAPPLKKRRYIPGGPGGGGRYVDEDGQETPVGGTGPGGYAYTGPRGPIGRMNAQRQGIDLPSTPTRTYNRRPRRERPPAGPRSSSAAAAAAKVAQTDGYKPREERGWEEFHPDLDIDADLPIFSADQVDGISPAESGAGTPPNNGTTPSQAAVDSRALALDDALRKQQADQDASNDPSVNAAANGTYATPVKRRPGRPPRKHDAMLNGLGSPPPQRVPPAPTMNPKEKLTLPKPSYRLVDPFKAFDESDHVKVNYVDGTLAKLGYQQSELFNMPRSLIRLEDGSLHDDLDLTLQSDAAGQGTAVPLGRAEYDMDEQDEHWLKELNTRRLNEPTAVAPVKPAWFEIAMTQIEKEWHALEKRIPKPNPKPPQTHRPRSSSAAAVNGEPAAQGEEQDTKCAICDDGDCENTNAIVFCDGCDLAVHQECYGVPFIPEGQWLCRRCQLVGRGTPILEQPGCIFCPNWDGAFKQTTNMKWAHLLCAMWIPEVSLGNPTFQEPVQDVEKVPKTRWRLTCYICKQKWGACIQCGHKSCFEAFHVTCARKARLCLRMKSSQAADSLDAVVLKAYCDKHSPQDWRRDNDVDGALADAKAFYRHTMHGIDWPNSQTYALSIGNTAAPPSVDGGDEAGDDSGNKRKRGQPVRSWRLPSGAPVVPELVYNNVESALTRLNISKKKNFVQEACRYWTLKREARRGAALLKRLQLQMEAFSSMEITRRNFAGMGAAGRPKLKRRIEFAEELQKDMAQILALSELVKEREAKKLEDTELMADILESIYFPLPAMLRPIIARVFTLDSKQGYFTDSLKRVQMQLEEYYYTSVQTFTEDLMSALSSGIGFVTLTNVGDAEQQLSGVAHSSLTLEQKQRKALAKRILKDIQPLLQEAAKNESDLAGKPHEIDLPDLEALLNRKMRENANTAEDAANASDDKDAEGDQDADGQYDEDLMEDVEPKENGNMHMAPTPDDNTTDHMSARDESSDEAAIAAQFNQDAMHSTEPMDLDPVEGDKATPIDGPAPLTPPRSEKDLLAPLANGGIPWYMEPFEPDGTTVHDEKWTGRELMRAMSEEMSEMDEDELRDLDAEVMQPQDAGAGVPAAVSPPAAQKRKRTRSQR